MRVNTTDFFRRLLKNPENRKKIYLNALGKLKEAKVVDEAGTWHIIKVVGRGK